MSKSRVNKCLVCIKRESYCSYCGVKAICDVDSANTCNDCKWFIYTKLVSNCNILHKLCNLQTTIIVGNHGNSKVLPWLETNLQPDFAYDLKVVKSKFGTNIEKVLKYNNTKLEIKEVLNDISEFMQNGAVHSEYVIQQWKDCLNLEDEENRKMYNSAITLNGQYRKSVKLIVHLLNYLDDRE